MAIPSEEFMLMTDDEVRASWYLPTAELLWSTITFGFAAVQNVKHVFALRFVLGMLESPFAVGVLTVMGGYYTKRGSVNRFRSDRLQG